MASGQSTFTAFVDMRKAFDWVDRDMLFYKLLSQFNVTGKMYRAIVSLYSNPISCVRLNNNNTDWFKVTSGVKQGDCLSPTLFGMFLNDLAVEIKSINCGVDIENSQISILLYADDIVLIAPDENRLQKQIDCLYKWCRKWRMCVNQDKTQVVHFRPVRTAITEYTFKFGDSVLDLVKEYKYLGVVFDEHMYFRSNADILSASACRAMGLLRYKLRYIKECRFSTYTNLYASFVCPILDYCSGVWGIKTFDSMEKVHMQALRYFMGVPKHAAHDVLLGDSGWLSCNSRHKLAVIRLWNRLIGIPSYRLTNKVFLWDLTFAHKKGSWANSVLSIFHDIGIQRSFDSLITCDMQDCYERLKSAQVNKWDTSRYGKPKLRYYNMCKSVFETEEYLLLGIPKFQRSLFAKLRAGVLPLNIEIGRYRNVDLCDRLCTLCDSNAVEDEIHFVTTCEMYKDIRSSMYADALALDPTFDSLDNIDKFVFLMSNLQKNVIKFISAAYVIRRNAIYTPA